MRLAGKFLAFTLALLILHVQYATAQTALSSTREDQTGLAVTVYNTNLGLVKDTREIGMGEGIQELKFMDVAEQINPATVHIKSLTHPLAVLEQNYEYDLLNPQKLLEKYVGKEVHFIEIDEKTKEEKRTRATLLSANNGAIYQVEGQIMFDIPGRIVFPEIPDNLIAKPTLVWLLRTNTPGDRKVEVSYLTDGLNWRADYVAALNRDDTAIDLSGWVTIDNHSGATYADASLKLVAGDVQRVGSERPPAPYRGVSALKMADAQQFEEEAFFEYHIYTLDRKTTLKNNQTKQMNLLNSSNIPVRKKFIFTGRREYYFGQLPRPQENRKVGIFLQFENTARNNLGMPLPKGTLRVYKKDGDGSVQFIGEDRIDHTPKDETLKIKVGEAFDIVAERKQTDYRKVSDTAHQVAFEITIRNHKDEAVQVDVVEPVPGDWEMMRSSHEYEKTEAHEITFPVTIPAGKTATLTYGILVKF